MSKTVEIESKGRLYTVIDHGGNFQVSYRKGGSIISHLIGKSDATTPREAVAVCDAREAAENLSDYSDRIKSDCCGATVYLRLYADVFDSGLHPVSISETDALCRECGNECDIAEENI